MWGILPVEGKGHAMPTCTKCRQPYDEGWDGCPNCHTQMLKDISAIRGAVWILVAVTGLAIIAPLFR
jgi:hypothetical protein